MNNITAYILAIKSMSGKVEEEENKLNPTNISFTLLNLFSRNESLESALTKLFLTT